MITSREYDQLCKVTDDLRSATEALYTAGVSGGLKEAARQFVMAEDAWGAFTIRLVEDTAADVDGWIEWGGGECPVAEGTPTEVKFRHGGTAKSDSPEFWDWINDGMSVDIIAYRVVS